MRGLLSLALAVLMNFNTVGSNALNEALIDGILDKSEILSLSSEFTNLELDNSNIPDETVIYPDRVPKETTIKLTFAGDCMLATSKGKVYSGSFSSKALEGDWEYFFGGVVEHFKSDDFTIINLENVLTDDSSLKEVWKDHNPAYWYKAPTENTKIMTSSSVEVANLANNHLGDYGTKGRTDTMKACEDAGVMWANNDKVLYLEKDGYTIALICHGLWFEGQEQTIINKIKDASEKSDFQIVYYHGGKERVHSPENWKIRASRRLVDGGADLVIGNHPHVLQPREVYNGVEIIYSMGNFCFGGNSKPENRTILYKYNITFDDKTKQIKTTESEIIPCYVYTGSVSNWRPEIITEPDIKQRVLDFMDWKINSPV